MGFLWISAVVIYGLATYQLGPLGDSAGWVYQITMVLTACAAGVLAVEWRSSSRGTLAVFLLGINPLMSATLVLARATK
jgi:L-rhamnose-H+ transport protein